MTHYCILNFGFAFVVVLSRTPPPPSKPKFWATIREQGSAITRHKNLNELSLLLNNQGES